MGNGICKEGKSQIWKGWKMSFMQMRLAKLMKYANEIFEKNGLNFENIFFFKVTF